MSSGPELQTNNQQQHPHPGPVAPTSKLHGQFTPGGTHPLAALSPTAALFGGAGVGFGTGLVTGAVESAAGTEKPIASVNTHNKVHPAQAGVSPHAPVDPAEPQKGMPLQDRAWVEAHRKELGMPPDMPAEQFFQEFLAHQLAYKKSTKDVPNDAKDPSKGMHQESNYTEYERKMLQAWGYSDKPQEVMDEKSGLYAARFDPLKGAKGPDGKPLHSEVAFRGTADLGGIEADTSKYIGATQYEPHKKEIAALMHGGVGQVSTSGHSLGGALAQKAAADNLDVTGGVTTFQAPGIDYADAARFNAANRDHHIDVAHHYVSSDTVHRAGDQKVGGTFYENKVAGLDGAMSAPGLALANVQPSHRGYMYYNNGSGNLRDPNSKWAKDGVSTNVTTEEHGADTVHSRHFHEGVRQGAGALATAGLGAVRGTKDILQGANEGFHDAAHGIKTSAQETGQGLQHAGSEGLHGVKTAGSGLAQGGSEILHGNIKSGLGHAGQGLAQGTGEVLKGGADAAGALWHGAVGTTKAVGQGALDLGKGVLKGGDKMLHAGIDATYQAGKAAMHLPQAAGELGHWAGHEVMDGAKYVGGKAVEGGKAALSATGKALSATGHALDDGAHWAGNKVKNGWHSLTGW